MILSDSRVLEEIKKGNIVIDPFDEKCLGCNSYDVHLSNKLCIYRKTKLKDNGILGNVYGLDSKNHTGVSNFEIGEDGYILYPHELYLGSTLEYSETHGFVPFCEGKSSIGRLGISIHQTAGRGDAGFCGHWTLELSVIHPVKIYPNMKIGQIIYFNMDGKVSNPYNKKKDAKYNNKSVVPQESKMFENFVKS